MTLPSWVALHGIAHSFTELHKLLCHDKAKDPRSRVLPVYYSSNTVGLFCLRAFAHAILAAPTCCFDHVTHCLFTFARYLPKIPLSNPP